MVFLTRISSKPGPKVLRKYLQGRYIDSLRVYVKGGAGGMGLPKFGGIGGKGGDVFVVAKEGANLTDIVRKYPSKRIVATNGRNSHHRSILGEPGANVTFEAPIGVTIVGENGRTLGELNEDGTTFQVAQGGPGGCPSSGYSGTKGQAHSVTLDLKLIADVGLVGFPNAGKSTLLRAISKAKPKIASYPFTTIRPNVGVMEFDDLRQISVADLPGLVEGAHANVGMGHRFLKHVERTKLLLLVVDIGGFQLSCQHTVRSCLETVLLLNKELELYKPELLDKPALLVVNKMDTEGALEAFNKIKYQLNHLEEVLVDFPATIRPDRSLHFKAVLQASARLGTGVKVVRDEVRLLIDGLVTRGHTSEAQLIAQLRAEMTETGPALT